MGWPAGGGALGDAGGNIRGGVGRALTPAGRVNVGATSAAAALGIAPMPSAVAPLKRSASALSSLAAAAGPSPKKQSVAAARGLLAATPPTALGTMPPTPLHAVRPAPGAAVAVDVDDEVFLGDLQGSVVGVRYYSGIVVRGEHVMLRREPTNPYDRNAIQVCNVARKQVGHIPRATAAILAPLMDRGILRVEGVFLSEKGAYEVPIRLQFYSTRENEDEVWKWFSARNFLRRAPQPPPPPVQAPKMPTLSVRVTDLERGGSRGLSGWSRRGDSAVRRETYAPVIGNVCNVRKGYGRAQASPATNRFAHTAAAVPKAGTLLAHLERAPHSSHGVQHVPVLVPKGFQDFDILGTSSFQFTPPCSRIVRKDVPKAGKKIMYYNLATRSAQIETPKLARGGLLSDDMGLGKTIQVIALILSDPSGAGILPKAGTVDKTAAKTTLIVCPLSVVANWTDQIDKHVASGTLKYYVFHGPARVSDPAFLQSFDVVVTTYNTLAASHKSDASRGGLHKVFWRRVVLDEGHIIRNRKSKQAAAAFELQAERRIILSGTPIQNSLLDFFSLLKFLQFSPLNEYDWFNRIIQRPCKNQDPEGFDNLKMLLSTLCLRRLKTMRLNGKPIIELPPVSYFLHEVEFKYQEEKDTYAALNAELERSFEEFASEDGSQTTYAHILEILMRLRQTCNHVRLIGERRLLVKRAATELFANPAKDPADPKMQKLLAVLRENLDEDCAVCLDTLKKPSVTQCGHFFCFDCIVGVISFGGKASGACPMCRADLVRSNVYDLPPTAAAGEDDAAAEEDDDGNAIASQQPSSQPDPAPSLSSSSSSSHDGHESSSKIDALVELLGISLASDRTAKAVVFSQWAKMLDKVEPLLAANGVKYARFDGAMSRRVRSAQLQAFKSDAAVSVLLCTLQCASFGLNLTEGNLVVLLDPWWNLSVETQAIDRCNRLGQTRPVTVVRLVTKGTVEDKVLKIQDRKRELLDRAFGGSGGGGGG
ncbi:SNF2 family N-terminal domain-containing protein, partial [Zopfochytrium polystomum]